MQVYKKITKEITISPESLTQVEKITNLSELKEKIEQYLEKNVSELLEIILAGAILLDASDLHLEPQEEETKLRARVDGILQDVLLFKKDVSNLLFSRLKLLSELKLNITDKPQDGRFSIILKENSIEIRTSTIPAEFGESLVLRILNPKNLIGLESLGLRKDLYQVFERETKKPNGMIIVTGPTGSGKTTTLYAFLKKVQRPDIKIITIEDPIEYHLEGISQTQVEPTKGYDFASGLRSIMRQDPDVILVGEIRDLQTCQIALQAALTGHLVFSTLHTNDAAGTIARLQALGEKAVNITPAINMVVAQRLVRKVCQKCRKYEKINRENLEKFKKALKGKVKTFFSRQTKMPKAVGCKFCNFTGYKGRIGIFEAFVKDEEIEEFILKSAAVSGLKKLAIKKGMLTMYQDGLLKVLEGITTIEELEKVASPD